MIDIAGYDVRETLYHSPVSTVLRATRTDDGTSVVVKWLSTPAPTPKMLARYRYAWEVSRDLELEGVTRTLALTKVDDRPALVTEDIGGVSLRQLIERRGQLSVLESLGVVKQVADALSRLHAAKVIHRDINPSNIVATADLSRVQIIDFDVSTRLLQEKASAKSARLLEGTLAYISPEQTGRVNRSTDHRTDLYSLGVTLYELVCGTRPFDAEDPLAMVHSHIAVAPEPAHERASHVPLVVSRIIAKLLAKMPGERYQSASGLSRDLTRCLDAMLASEPIPDFELGRGDVSPWLQVSQRLYGRDDAVATLRQTFERVSGGTRELLLVSGFSGVGKSRLVHEALRDVSLRNGHFISGKYGQVQTAPHAGLIRALRAFVQDLLTEPDEVLAVWRARFRDALKLNAAVIVDVLPELALIIGQPKPPPMLDPGESLSRFQRVMVAFVRVLASADAPLVLFLDDLQWCDRSSLGLIEALLRDAGQSHLLVIGAWRDAHGPQSLAVRQWRDGLVDAGIPTTTLALSPIDRAASDALVADTLALSTEEVAPLNDALWERTRGNPFYIEQVLLGLEDVGGLQHDVDLGRWTWDLEKVQRIGLTEQVGDLLARRLERLPARAQAAVGMAGCLGGSFELGTLAKVTQQSVAASWSALWPALQEGLLVAPDSGWREAGLTPDGGMSDADAASRVTIRFAHDRVREAAYASHDATRLPEVHLMIARTLRDVEGVFSVVSHYNAGLHLVDDTQERVSVAAMNLDACTKALQSGAFGTALAFAESGMDALGEGAWEQTRELALQLTRFRADTAQLNGRFDEAMALLDTAMSHAHAPPEKVELFDVRMQLHTRVGAPQLAITTGVQALSELFGFVAPDSPGAWGAAIGAEMGGVQQALGAQDPMALLDKPPLADMAVFLELRVLTSMVGPAYVNLQVLPFVIARMVRLSATHGTAPFSPLGYMTWAVLLCSQGQYAAGARFGQLALTLAERMGARALEAPLYQIFGPFVQHWTAPIDDVMASVMRAIHAGVETGSYTFAGWSANNVPMVALARGAPLADTLAVCGETRELVEKTLAYSEGVSLANLMRFELLELTGEDDERAEIASMGLKDPTLAFRGTIDYFRLFNHVVFGRYDQAQEAAVQVAANLAHATAHLFIPVFRYLETILAAERAAESEDRAEAIAKVRENIALFEQWSALNANAQAPYLRHAEAELAALEGRLQDAEAGFDRAASAARDVGMGYAEALACERAWRWFSAAGKRRTARSFLVDAHYAWVRWGAAAKSGAMEALHPRLRASGRSPTSTVTATDMALDVHAVMRASQAISSELILEDLLATLMRTVMETAGAERGFLLLRRGDQLGIDAAMESSGGATQLMANASLDDAELCQPIVRLVERALRRVVLSDALGSERFGRDADVVERGVRSVLCTPVIDKGKLIGVLYLENNLAPDAFTEDRCQMLDILAAQAAISIENALFYERQERVRQSMARFVPSEFVQLVGKSDLTEVSLGDAVERSMGVLFSDVRSFTTISESMLPMEIFSYLNGYLERAGPVIRSNGGFIDKYIGDAVLALFPTSPGEALQAIVSLYRELTAYNLSNLAHGRPTMDIGAALHWGKVALGTIGEARRLDATAISDTVNTASRLEAMTKKWGARAIVSGEVMELVSNPDAFPHRFVGQVVLRGRKQSTPIYDLFAVEPEPVIALRLQTRAHFEEAVQLLHNRDLQGAHALLTEVLGTDPNDRVARYLLSVAREPLRTGR